MHQIFKYSVATLLAVLVLALPAQWFALPFTWGSWFYAAHLLPFFTALAVPSWAGSLAYIQASTFGVGFSTLVGLLSGGGYLLVFAGTSVLASIKTWTYISLAWTARTVTKTLSGAFRAIKRIFDPQWIKDHWLEILCVVIVVVAALRKHRKKLFEPRKADGLQKETFTPSGGAIATVAGLAAGSIAAYQSDNSVREFFEAMRKTTWIKGAVESIITLSTILASSKDHVGIGYQYGGNLEDDADHNETFGRDQLSSEQVSASQLDDTSIQNEAPIISSINSFVENNGSLLASLGESTTTAASAAIFLEASSWLYGRYTKLPTTQAHKVRILLVGCAIGILWYFYVSKPEAEKARFDASVRRSRAAEWKRSANRPSANSRNNQQRLGNAQTLASSGSSNASDLKNQRSGRRFPRGTGRKARVSKEAPTADLISVRNRRDVQPSAPVRKNESPKRGDDEPYDMSYADYEYEKALEQKRSAEEFESVVDEYWDDYYEKLNDLLEEGKAEDVASRYAERYADWKIFEDDATINAVKKRLHDEDGIEFYDVDYNDFVAYTDEEFPEAGGEKPVEKKVDFLVSPDEKVFVGPTNADGNVELLVQVPREGILTKIRRGLCSFICPVCDCSKECPPGSASKCEVCGTVFDCVMDLVEHMDNSNALGLPVEYRAFARETLPRNPRPSLVDKIRSVSRQIRQQGVEPMWIDVSTILDPAQKRMTILRKLEDQLNRIEKKQESLDSEKLAQVGQAQYDVLPKASAAQKKKLKKKIKQEKKEPPITMKEAPMKDSTPIAPYSDQNRTTIACITEQDTNWKGATKVRNGIVTCRHGENHKVGDTVALGKYDGDKLVMRATAKVVMLGNGVDEKDPAYEDIMVLSVPAEFSGIKSKTPKVLTADAIGAIQWRKFGSNVLQLDSGRVKADGTHRITTESGASGSGVLDPALQTIWGVHIGAQGQMVNKFLPFTDERISRLFPSN